MAHYSNLRKFVVPEIIFGIEARKLAGKYAKQFLAAKVLIVTDPGIIKSGWLKDVENSLTEESIPYVVYSNVSPNPRATEIMEGAEIYKSEKCDIIISIGGGSPMDCAKGIGIVSTNDKNILNFKGVDKIIIPPPPLILIPTTAGTSADVSQFCIVYNRDELNKIAIISKAIVPDVALIDSETTTTMDNYLTACTGMDALSHAIEAFVSIGSGHLTDSHAIEAVDILFNNLPKLLQNPSNLELREKVMHGSLKAGLAFSNASLGAVHAMAHSLGGFLDLPHGECNSMLLDHVIRFNFKNSVEKFKVIASKFDIDTRGLSTSEIKNKLLSSVISFKKEIGIIDQLSDKGVKSSDIPILAEKAVMDACILTNPRKATKKDISVIFEESM